MHRRAVLAIALIGAGASVLDAQPSCWNAGPADQTGPRGRVWVVQRSYDDLRVCGAASDGEKALDAPPREWPNRAALLVLEARLGGTLHTLRLAPGPTTYTVNEVARPTDAPVDELRGALLDVLDAEWELHRLRVRLRDTTLDVAAMRRELTELRNTDRTLREELSQIRAEQKRLRADVSHERNAISLLQSQLKNATQAERSRVRRDIQRHHQEIQTLERSIERLEMSAHAKESRLATLDVVRRTEELERTIRDFDSPPGTRDLESRSEAAVQRLRSILRAR